jgi:hypothetical protein
LGKEKMLSVYSSLTALLSTICLLGGTHNVVVVRANDAPEVQFYQEDLLGTARMMLDFVTTPMYFVALFKYRPMAVYEDGRATNLTGFDADKIYTKVILSELLPDVGGELVFIANLEDTTTNTTSTDPASNQSYWDAMAVLYFPNSVAFGRMAANDKFQALSVHKKAGLEDHLVFACESIAGTSMDAYQDAKTNIPTLWNTTTTTSAVSRDSSVEMAPVASISFIKYQRYPAYQQGDADASQFQSGREAVQHYNKVTLPLQMETYGMRTAMEFEVKRSLIQTALEFDTLRIDTFPSHEALRDASDDKTVLNEYHHFAAGVEDALSLQGGPLFVNSLGGNGQMGYYQACSSTHKTLYQDVLEGGGVDTSSYCP